MPSAIERGSGPLTVRFAIDEHVVLPQGAATMGWCRDCLRVRQNRVVADPPPDHMRFAGPHLGLIAKRRASVRRPGQLPDTGVPVYAMHTQRWRKRRRLLAQPLDQLIARGVNGRALLAREPRELAPKARLERVGGRQPSGRVVGRGDRVEQLDELAV